MFMRASIVMLTLAALTACSQNDAVVQMHGIDGTPSANGFGTITFRDSEHGLLIQPALRGMSPGPHALHLHQFPNCGAGEVGDGHTMPGGAAGGHYDPYKTGRHRGPFGDGHLGDLPNLIVESDGVARIPVIAPRVELKDMRRRAVMLHAMPDRYNDEDHHSHGGLRAYCGVLE